MKLTTTIPSLHTFLFFFNDTATTELYPLSLHDALPILLVAAFVAIRFIDIYGDPVPWSTQPSSIFTVLSFINTTKYPPSLLYLLMTLGPSLVALSWFESWPHKAALITFGRVPLFF